MVGLCPTRLSWRSGILGVAGLRYAWPGEPPGRDGQQLHVVREPRISRLVLFAPAAGWYAAPGALRDVPAEMRVYAAELDTVTPAEDVALLANAAVPVDMRIVAKAG